MKAIRSEQWQQSSKLRPVKFFRHNSRTLQAHPLTDARPICRNPYRVSFRLRKLSLLLKISSRLFLSSVRNRSRQLHSSSPLPSRSCSEQVRQASACWRRRRIFTGSRLVSTFLRIESIPSLCMAFPLLQSETISNKPGVVTARRRT